MWLLELLGCKKKGQGDQLGGYGARDDSEEGWPWCSQQVDQAGPGDYGELGRGDVD